MSETVSSDPIQLNMNFAGSCGNRFKEHLDNAEFSLLFEMPLPSADADLASSVEKKRELARFTACSEIPSGLAFTDGDPAYPSMDPCTFASALCPDRRDSHVLYVTGRNSSAEKIAGLLGHWQEDGFRNVVCVSGLPPEDPACTSGPVESPQILKISRSFRKPLFAGCTVNPFQYEQLTLHACHSKLIKKFNAGAQFAVAQYGADLAKLQELIWILFRNNRIYPVFSRILLLDTEEAEEICAGRRRGLFFTRDMVSAIRKEMQFSSRQFEAAQWRRLQLHAAGVRLFGCSGLQIGGIRTAEQAQAILNRIREAFREFQTYEDWLQAYFDYYARMSLTPYPWRYYLFDNLLTGADGHEKGHPHKEDFRIPASGEFFRYNLAHFLFSKASSAPAGERHFSKKLIVGCRSCLKCRLPECMYVCPERCPAGFANGVCGEILCDGSCPYRKGKNRECPHLLRMRLAIYNMDFTAQEKTIVEKPEKTFQ